MKKTKSFITIILLFSLLLCFSISKASATTGHYITIIDRAGQWQTITTPGYTTKVTSPGRHYYVLNNYGSISSVWIPTTYISLWHPGTIKRVWRPAITHKVWVATVH